MKAWHYVRNGSSLRIDLAACIGCGACTVVCPHQILAMDNGKARITDRLACMECGAGCC